VTDPLDPAPEPGRADPADVGQGSAQQGSADGAAGLASENADAGPVSENAVAGSADAEGRVAAVLADLDAASDLPPADQVAAFETAQETLQATLARIDDR
jgi:hypothetical protein